MSTLFSTGYYKQKPFKSTDGIANRRYCITDPGEEWVSEPVLDNEGLNYKTLDFNHLYEARVI